MGRITKPLTNTEIQHAKARAKEYSLGDGGGLLLRVKPCGSKLWIFNYSRPHTKKRTNMSFGAYPDISLLEARELRDQQRKLLAKNIDPKEQRDIEYRQEAEKHLSTLKGIAEEWFKIKATKVTAGYANDIWRSLSLHVFPQIGDLPLHKVTAPKAIEVLKPVAAAGSLETVRRLCQRLNEIMTFAVNTGLLASNPLTGINKAFQSPQRHHMPTLQPDELPELMKALNTANIRLTTRCLIEWQLHTMVRPGEAAATEWAEIDEVNKVWRIPAERMKKKRPHVVPLTQQMLELLTVMRSISGRSVYMFPSRSSMKKHTNESTANMALKRMGYGGKLVAHGLRSIASTTLNEQEFDFDVVEAALAHVDQNDVRSAYNRTDYLERRKPMMEWWSNYIEEAATGNMSICSGKGLKVV